MPSEARASLPMRVAARHVLAEGIVGFDLMAIDGMPLPWYSAGSHVDVLTPTSQLRPYSLYRAHEPGQPYRIAVLHEPASRGGSAAMHTQVQVGQLLNVGMPRNLFPLNEHAPHSLLLAGGIGITPLLAMAERLLSLGQSFSLFYASKSRRHAAFAQALMNGPMGPCTQLHHDDEAGSPPDQLSLLREAPAGTHVYVCGPAGFMQSAQHAADALDWPRAQWHTETFSAPVASTVPAGGDQPFQLTLARSGRVVRVQAGQTIVDALASQGVQVPVSCEQGLCGTCETRVLSGQVEHRDFHYSAAERQAQDRMLVCCSRAAGEHLTLDL